MKRFIFLLIAIFIAYSHLQETLKFYQYCSRLNYPIQDHLVPTTDHYNLRFYRIQAKNSVIAEGKRVIYLQHGLADSADTWIVNDEDLAPAFYFANRGFDVWLGNSRGNRYSHAKLSSNTLSFWDFTFDDMAKFDLPAAFKYINKVTNMKIHYIGHSQGTLIMFIALASNITDVYSNIASFNAYAPVAYLQHQKSKMLASLSKTRIINALYTFKAQWLLMLNDVGMKTLSNLCKTDPIICKNGLKQISQMNNTVNNMRRLPVVMGHFPAGTSSKNMLHFQQFILKGQFKQFDYGQKKNMIIYRQKTPPFYNLSKITLPVHLHVGKYDKLADIEDVNRLFKELQNSNKKTMGIYDYGHATFVWGLSTKHLEASIKIINSVQHI